MKRRLISSIVSTALVAIPLSALAASPPNVAQSTPQVSPGSVAAGNKAVDPLFPGKPAPKPKQGTTDEAVLLWLFGAGSAFGLGIWALSTNNGAGGNASAPAPAATTTTTTGAP